MPDALFLTHQIVMLRGWKLHSDGRLYHAVITEQVRYVIEMREKDKLRKQGKRAAAKTGNQPLASAVRPDSVGVHPVSAVGSGSGSGLEPKNKDKDIKQADLLGDPPPKSPAKNKHPLPADFGISDRVRAWASKNVYGNLEQHLDYFVLQAQSKGYRYVDWDSALMVAIRQNWACIAEGRPVVKHVPKFQV